MTLKDFIYNALKTKFKDKGRNYSYSDCYGIIYLGYKDVLGVNLPEYLDDYIDAGNTKASRRVISDFIISQKHNWEKVETPKALDVILFRFGDTQTHIGLVIDKDRFIHCEKKINTVIERLNSAKWEKRIEGIYRLKDKNVQ